MLQRCVVSQIKVVGRSLASSSLVVGNQQEALEALERQHPHRPTVRIAPSAMASRQNSNRVAFASAGLVLGAGVAFMALRRHRSKFAGGNAAKAIAVKEVHTNGTHIGVAPTVPAAPRKPPTEKEPCEGCDCGLMEPGPIEGTMHAYERHVIICSGQEDWPKVIEAEESSLAESLFNMCLGAGLIWTKKAAKEAEENKQTTPKNRVKITACPEPSRGPVGTTDVIVYPEGLVYSLPTADLSTLEYFVKSQLADGEVASKLQPTPVPYQKMVLVCTHMSRDKRCGRAGPQVLEEMAKELDSRGIGSDQIALRGSSHFGGHRFAGVLIIYPQGDWYGLVNKKNAAAIIDKCVLGTEGMKGNWRGNMANPGVKAEPAAKSAVNTAAVAAKPVSEPVVANGDLTKPRRDSVDGA